MIMPDSNITKKLLAGAFRELLETTPFGKITVGDICAACGMNRKSFYYHFKDKYDLVNWIFFTEFAGAALNRIGLETKWTMFEDVCFYFYENRDFYRKMLAVEEQNSFSEYFMEFLQSVFYEYMKMMIGEKNDLDFYITFYSDAIICAIKRWIMDRNCCPPERFTELVKFCIRDTAKIAQQDAADSPDR